MYRCINPYYSQYMTKRVGYGDIITPDQYYSLPPTEKIKFTLNEESTSSATSLPDDISWASSQDTSTSWDLGSSSDSSSSYDPGFGFGGGDGGGAGSSGDW